MKEKFEVIIGLEIHVELKTQAKMFCGCSAFYFGQRPNSHTCPVCLGLPGALPVPNKQAVTYCLMLGTALNCQIPFFSKFDRKNYFYPDLPKGYQISQYDLPFAKKGYLETSGRKIGITRVHMEEDTGKLLHTKIEGKNCTLIDFNRSGVPLVEIVTEPGIRGSWEAKNFLEELRLVIRYLAISDADMEKGSMRLEPNISLRKLGDNSLPSYKVEVKNINSFNFVKKAIDYEIERQIEILGKGDIPKQETRGYDEARGVTYSQRSKEEAHDYRYFPEPDIPPIVWKKEEIEKLRKNLPELPQKRQKRFVCDFGLKEHDAAILINDIKFANYFEESINIVRHSKIGDITPQELANWIINKKIDLDKSVPATLIKEIQLKRHKLQIPADFLDAIISETIKNNPKAVSDYKKGKEASLMFLLGQVLRQSQGKGDPLSIKEKIKKEIS